MKLSDIEVGGRYTAKVSGVITTVRITAIKTSEARRWNTYRAAPEPYLATRIDAVNEATGRRLTLKSAARLRRAVTTTAPNPAPPAGTGA